MTKMARAFDLGTRRRRFAMSSRKVYLSTEVCRRLAVPRLEGKNQTAQGRRRIGDRLKGQFMHRLTRTAGQGRSDTPLNPITVCLMAVAAKLHTR